MQIRTELQQSRRERDQVDLKLATMEQQVGEFNAQVARLSQQADKDQRRLQMLVKERDSLQQKVCEMQTILDKLQISDADQFKQDFEQLRADIVKLKRQLSDKQAKLQAKE